MNYVLMIPVLFNLIKTMESVMPDSPGKQKFDAVMAAVTELYGDVTANAPQITSLVNAFVTALNAAGVFAKKS